MIDDQSRAPTIAIRPASSGARVPEDQDCLLLQRMADGDESALGELYDRWSQRVHTVAFWMLSDADDAEDVVEETFWQAWRTAGQFDPGRASGSTWLLMIGRSRALDRLRAQRRRAERTGKAAASTLVEDYEGSTHPAVLQPEVPEPSRKLTQALEALPQEQREALELAYLAGLSHAEIAAQTGQPLGTVKTRIRLAMDKLRQKLSILREPGRPTP
jgi:RNA polymerase sigma-70 factor (ECF subfamily)